MNNTRTKTVIYTLLHFLVDLTTIYVISGVILGPEVGVVHRGAIIIVYNLVAFAGQLPIGVLADVIKKNALFVTLGCLLAGLSYPIVCFFPWVSCVTAAIGNGLFHIGAGADVLKMTTPKAGPAGLFVSSGALGVWFAYKLNGGAVLYILPAIMLACAVVSFVLYKTEKCIEKSMSVTFIKPQKISVLAIICFLLTVVIRSLMGMVMNYSWKSVLALSFASVVAVVLGKAFGGYIGDKIECAKTAVVSLSISLLLFPFSFEYWQAGVVAILCFNMTMPLTLTAVADLTDKKYGMAFGLTTFALAMGFIPVVFNASRLFSVLFVMVCTAISLALMMVGYGLVKKLKQGR